MRFGEYTFRDYDRRFTSLAWGRRSVPTCSSCSAPSYESLDPDSASGKLAAVQMATISAPRPTLNGDEWSHRLVGRCVDTVVGSHPRARPGVKE